MERNLSFIKTFRSVFSKMVLKYIVEITNNGISKSFLMKINPNHKMDSCNFLRSFILENSLVNQLYN